MCKEMYNDLCENCAVANDFASCRNDYDSITLDDITRNVVECKNYVPKKPYLIKCTYECDGKIAVVEKETYKFPEHLPWRECEHDKKSDTLKNDEAKKSRFKKPTLDEVKAYCKEKNYKMNAEAFYNHFESNGWKVSGKAPMKNWKAAVNSWEIREKNKVQPKGPQRMQCQPTYDLNGYQSYAEENVEI